MENEGKRVRYDDAKEGVDRMCRHSSQPRDALVQWQSVVCDRAPNVLKMQT